MLEWCGPFSNEEVDALHAQTFGTGFDEDREWDWSAQVSRHSLGWVVARDGGHLVGFVNVLWDGLVHAWLQDTMVSAEARHRGIGSSLVAIARRGATEAGCEWLHVDFPDGLAGFYLDGCGFRPTSAGVIELKGKDGSTDGA